jgi:hypothetical protein
MARSVNSQRRPRKTRGSFWGWLGRRFGALVVTVAALGSVSWISPMLGGSPPRPQPQPKAPFAAPVQIEPARPLEIAAGGGDTTMETAQATPPAPRHRRRGVSLNAAHGSRADGFEVLNAAELDAISQAH